MNTEKTSLQFQNNNSQNKMDSADLAEQEIINFEEDFCDKENNANFRLSFESIEIKEFDIKEETTYSSNDNGFLDYEFSLQGDRTEHLDEDGNIPSKKYNDTAMDKCVTPQSNYKDCKLSFSGSLNLKKRRQSKRATGSSKLRHVSGSPAVTTRLGRIQTKHQLLQCDHCSHSTPRKDRMLRHMLTHSQLFPYIPTNLRTEKKLVRCQDCTFSTYRKDSMVRHVLTHSKLFPHACSMCSFRCNDAYGLKRHQAIKHMNVVQAESRKRKSSNFVCEVCGFESQFSCKLNVHMKTHESRHPRRYCTLCSFSSCFPESLRRHVRRCPAGAQSRLLSCPSCAYSTAESRHLRRHRNTHLGSTVNVHQCADCGEYFNSKSIGFHRRERCKGRN